MESFDAKLDDGNGSAKDINATVRLLSVVVQGFRHSGLRLFHQQPPFDKTGVKQESDGCLPPQQAPAVASWQQLCVIVSVVPSPAVWPTLLDTNY